MKKKAKFQGWLPDQAYLRQLLSRCIVQNTGRGGKSANWLTLGYHSTNADWGPHLKDTDTTTLKFSSACPGKWLERWKTGSIRPMWGKIRARGGNRSILINKVHKGGVGSRSTWTRGTEIGTPRLRPEPSYSLLCLLWQSFNLLEPRLQRQCPDRYSNTGEGTG